MSPPCATAGRPTTTRQQREFNVTLIDYDEPANNTYHFSEEVWFEDRDRRRLDMVLYVNGLPVALIENKSPKLLDPGQEGFDQVQKTYTTNIPEFIKHPVPFAICATRLEYGATWNPSLNAFYKWKVDGRDFGLEALSKRFFAKEQVLRLLRDYTIFYRMDDALQKFILRPHQMRAVEKIVARVVAGQVGDDLPTTGLEWHTQGSGKTLTMIVSASKLRRQDELNNPTLLIVVDRIEPETQMTQNLEALGPDAIRATSRRHLQELLENDTRGVIVTTIHKFENMPKNLVTRRNVVLLVDGAHRSQGEGDLGISLRAKLPNAFHFGFTGTPIDRGKVGKGTYATFGAKGDPQGVHDQYSINESIEDRHHAALYYTLAPTELWVDKLKLESQFADLLDEFWAIVDEEGAGTQEALSRLLQRADKLMAVLKAPQRIDAIAAHMAQHYQENVLPRGFKALVVTPDRKGLRSTSARGPVPAHRVEHGGLFRESQEGFESHAGPLPGRRRREAGAQGLPRPEEGAQAAHRYPEAAHRLRCARRLRHVPGQAAQGPHPAPGHCPLTALIPIKRAGWSWTTSASSRTSSAGWPSTRAITTRA